MKLPVIAADLLIVDRNPAYNLGFLYSFGANTLDAEGKMIRSKGIEHTIKDGIVIENAKMMEAVAQMVAASKQGGRRPEATGDYEPWRPEQDSRP